MALKDANPSQGNKDQAQKSDAVSQHKRLAQGDKLPANNSGKGVQNP